MSPDRVYNTGDSVPRERWTVGTSVVMTGGAPAVEWAGPGMLHSTPQHPVAPQGVTRPDVSSAEGKTLL